MRQTTTRLIAVAACLAAFVALLYRRALTLPFVNDDFIILDKVARCSFLDLWKPRELLLEWYRPWSRELHYWSLFHVAGLREPLYHGANLTLWLVLLLLYHELVSRLTGRNMAPAIAVAAVAGLALWGAPLLWVAGVQDLWMLVFSLIFLHLLARGRSGWAAGALVLGLLSKETAAVLPVVAFAYLLCIERRGWWRAVRGVLGFVAIVVAWAMLHPTLHGRLLGAARHGVETEQRPSLLGTVVRTLLTQMNLDALPAPETHWARMWLPALLAAAALAAVILLAGRPGGVSPQAEAGRPSTRNLVAFGALWAALGWCVLLLPSIGWHAYYGSLGTLGCWFALGVMLDRHRRLAVAAVVALVALCEARESTPSFDWGTYWYMQRAGNFLGGIRARLLELHPTLPLNSRLYFAAVPNNIGFLSGDGPALRVWYQDPSLRALYLSTYRLRPRPEPAGPDYFFRFDLRDTLVEINPGPESTFTAERFTTAWRHDQLVIASQFMKGGNLEDVAGSYAKLWAAFPDHPSYALFAACAYDAVGDTAQARTWYGTARSALGNSAVEARRPELLRMAREFRAAALRSSADAGGP